MRRGETAVNTGGTPIALSNKPTFSRARPKSTRKAGQTPQAMNMIWAPPPPPLAHGLQGFLCEAKENYKVGFLRAATKLRSRKGHSKGQRSGGELTFVNSRGQSRGGEGLPRGRGVRGRPLCRPGPVPKTVRLP